MARVATHQLAVAVSNAGGLGLIAAGGVPLDILREEIRQAQALTDKPFGVNLMMPDPNVEAQADVVIEMGVKVVTTGAGTPKNIFPRLKEAGVVVIPVIASVKHARKMEELGVDAVVAEGQEAGGHIGQTSTMALLPQVVDSVNIPVLGAGGIGDGRSVAAMYALGAAGIQAGTIFLTAEECPIHANYQQAVLAATDTGTIVTGRKAKDSVRSLTNPMLVEFAQLEAANAPHEELEQLTLDSLARAVYEGDMETGSAMAGEIAGMFTEMRPARQIIVDLFAEAEAVAANLQIKY